MSYFALYRKYRPNNFSGIIGQDDIVTTLTNQIKGNKVSHAYMFTGTRGTGKTSIAKILARAINCQSPVDGDVCGKCEHCLNSDMLDIIEIDAASNNGVDYARDIRENVQYAPTYGRYKVYIIDEVHMLSQGAFNALLKTIEEPPAYVVFMLCTTEIHRVPATILSRCMRFDFRLIATDKLAKLVSDIFDKEGKKYDKEAVYAIAQAGDGSARDSLSIADRCFNLSNGKLTYDEVASVLGVTSIELIAQLAFSVLSGGVAEVFDVVSRLTRDGKDAVRISSQLVSYFRDALIVSICGKKAIDGLAEEGVEQLARLAGLTTNDRLINAIDTLTKLDSQLKYALSPTTLLEATLLRLATNVKDSYIDELSKRVARVEKQLLLMQGHSVDLNNAKSIWKGVLDYLDKIEMLMIVPLWTNCITAIGDGKLVVEADNSTIEMLKVYDKTLASVVKLVANNMPIVYKAKQQETKLTDEQMLKQLSSDIEII